MQPEKSAESPCHSIAFDGRIVDVDLLFPLIADLVLKTQEHCTFRIDLTATIGRDYELWAIG